MTTTRQSIQGAGNAFFQNMMYKFVIENLEPNLRFYDMGNRSAAPTGYSTVSWTRFSQLEVTPANAILNEGITPADVPMTANVVTATPVQYGIFVELTDLVLDQNPVNTLTQASIELANNMARIMDQAIQGVLAAGTRVLFADNVANRAAIGAANTLGAIDLIRAQASLAQANAKPYGEFYVAVMHPAVVSDLRRELGANSITEVTKYTTAPLKGEIGSIYGIRIVESSNIQTFASTVTVYPTYVFGRNAYGVVDFQALQTSYKPLGSGGTDDPLDQRATAAVKVNFASVILQPLAMLRIESATSGDLI